MNLVWNSFQSLVRFWNSFQCAVRIWNSFQCAVRVRNSFQCAVHVRNSFQRAVRVRNSFQRAVCLVPSASHLLKSHFFECRHRERTQRNQCHKPCGHLPAWQVYAMIALHGIGTAPVYAVIASCPIRTDDSTP